MPPARLDICGRGRPFCRLDGQDVQPCRSAGDDANAAPAIDRRAACRAVGSGQCAYPRAIQQVFRTAIVPDQSDRTYRTLTHAQIVALATAYRPRRAREDTAMDCDDYIARVSGLAG